MKRFLITFIVLLILPLNVWAKTESKAHIDIAFTIDNNYPVFTLLAINSILKNNYSKSDYTFYIVENNVTDKNKEMMRKFVEENHQKIEFINVDTYIIDQGKNFFKFSGRITPIAFARILLPDLLPNLDKVLYLDSDILVTIDLKPLFETNIKNYNAGMALNVTKDNGALDLYKFKHGYYNSGVILMNLKKCRQDNSPQKMIEFLRKNEEKFDFNKDYYDDFSPNKKKKSYWLYPDQDLINIVWDGKIKKLPQKWNNQCIWGESIEDPIAEGIYHYIGSLKPWEYLYKDHSFWQELYMDYWNETQFANYKYYCIYLNLRKNIKYTINKKIYRYEKIKNLIIHGHINRPILWLFYTRGDSIR